MASLLGVRWAEWGSEQVMSNIAVANSPRVTVLPHPRYCDCQHITIDTAFIHFIGDCRFQGDTYRKTGAAAIGHLRSVNRHEESTPPGAGEIRT